MEMISSSIFVFFLLSVSSVILQFSESATISVDGVSEWKNPSVHVGDTVVFKHKYNHSLYIFRSENAFNLCNFTQATLLTKPNSSSYTWHPSRPGFFYFAFNNGSLITCRGSEKFAVEVFSTPPPQSSSPLPELPSTAAPTPTPTTGGMISSSPSYPWPFRPREAASSPGPSPATTMQDKGGGGGVPFINSNPAVPLPTGEVDSATIRPMQTSGQQKQVVVVGFSTRRMILFCVVCFFVL